MRFGWFCRGCLTGTRSNKRTGRWWVQHFSSLCHGPVQRAQKGPWFSAWLKGMVWCVQRREEVRRPSQAPWLSLFVPVPAVVQSRRCGHLPSASEEPFLLYTFIFTASLRHPCGSVLILPLQKIEIFISPSISEELRFLSP